jgi:hypothetical protein
VAAAASGRACIRYGRLDGASNLQDVVELGLRGQKAAVGVEHGAGGRLDDPAQLVGLNEPTAIALWKGW